MARDRNRRVREAAEAVLVEGERITSHGSCWAAQARPRVPLLFLGRRQYQMALTDRRVLVFERRRRGPRASELVIGKRYETFTLEKVRRRRPLMQLQVRAMNGNLLVFEFRPGQRELGGELVARLTPSAAHAQGPSHLMSSLGAPAPTGPIKGGSAAAVTTTVASAPSPSPSPSSSSGPEAKPPRDHASGDSDQALFWGKK